MSLVPDSLCRAVIQRAGERCEYCGLTSRLQVGGFELDHIQPISRDGSTSLENLAFACPWPSFFQRATAASCDHVDAWDAITGERAPLFDPRTQTWQDHFQWSSTVPFEIVGQFPHGRATEPAVICQSDEMRPHSGRRGRESIAHNDPFFREEFRTPFVVLVNRLL